MRIAGEPGLAEVIGDGADGGAAEAGLIGADVLGVERVVVDAVAAADDGAVVELIGGAEAGEEHELSGLESVAGSVDAGVDGAAEDGESGGCEFGDGSARVSCLRGIGDGELGFGIKPADDAVVAFGASPFAFHAEAEHEREARGGAPGILDEPSGVGIAKEEIAVEVEAGGGGEAHEE